LRGAWELGFTLVRPCPPPKPPEKLGPFVTISILSNGYCPVTATSRREHSQYQRHYGVDRGGGLAPEARHVYRSGKEKMALAPEERHVLSIGTGNMPPLRGLCHLRWDHSTNMACLRRSTASKIDDANTIPWLSRQIGFQPVFLLSTRQMRVGRDRPDACLPKMSASRYLV
jgi:hypothetical protein